MVNGLRGRLGIRHVLVVVTGALFAMVAMNFTSVRVGALPKDDSDAVYYDSNNNRVAEHDFFCDGSHYSWGDQTLAQPGKLWVQHYPCSSPAPGCQVQMNIDDVGNVTLIWTDCV
jgi:hypothetical protein